MELPLIYALGENKLRVIEFLIINNVELNAKGKPSIPAAADRCSIDTIKLLIKHDAGLYEMNNVGSNALDRALTNGRYDLISELIALGFDVKKDGTILRSAVYKRAYPVI